MKSVKRPLEDLAQDATWNDDDEVVELEVKLPLDKVIPVRLTSDNWEALRQEATKLGVGPTTLARMWLLERLNRAERKKRSA
jgi:hypothetical protein